MTRLKHVVAIAVTILGLACSSNSGPPDESRIKATVNPWLQQQFPPAEVQSVGPVFSKSDTECETVITTTANWQWKATLRRSQDGKWYLATMFNGGREYEPNLEVK